MPLRGKAVEMRRPRVRRSGGVWLVGLFLLCFSFVFFCWGVEFCLVCFLVCLWFLVFFLFKDWACKERTAFCKLLCFARLAPKRLLRGALSVSYSGDLPNTLPLTAG